MNNNKSDELKYAHIIIRVDWILMGRNKKIVVENMSPIWKLCRNSQEKRTRKAQLSHSIQFALAIHSNKTIKQTVNMKQIY